MAYPHGRVSRSGTQVPPVVAELEAVFAALPDEELLTKLRGPRRRGPKGYDVAALWHSYIALYYLGLPSVSDLIRLLHDNPFIARACGFDEIPSQPSFSRFFAKLATYVFTSLVKKIMWSLADRCFRTMPGFGKYVAVDSTDIKAWSNRGKHRGASDPDAGLIVKTNTEGNKKYVWGYKVHILCDTTYELPIVIDVTRGNVNDSKRATPLLRQARYATNKFWPLFFIADSAYSSDRIREHVKRWYNPCRPIIDPNRAHKKAFARTEKTPEWLAIYNRRTALERLNGRLKGFRRLNSVRVRGRRKVRIHAMLSVIVCQAQALATGERTCVRHVA